MDKDKVRDEMSEFLKKVEAKPKIEEMLAQKDVKKKPSSEDTFEPKHAEYFEGQLQLRKITQEVMDYVHKRFHETRAQIPTQKIHSDGNIDYWVSSRKLLHKLTKELKSKFGGFTKESEQHFSFDHLTSKNIYRLNAYYEMHEQRIGDILIIEGSLEPFIVTGYKNERLVLQNVFTLKKNLIHVSDIEKTLERVKTKVLSVDPEIQILDQDFQPVNLEVPKGVTLQEDENIVVVNHNSTWYFVKS